MADDCGPVGPTSSSTVHLRVLDDLNRGSLPLHRCCCSLDLDPEHRDHGGP